MHEPLFSLFGASVTVWKIIGYLGVFIFASRWFVQMFASRKAGKPVITKLFWLLSLSGSVMLLAYFIFGKNDSVGIISNLFPAFIALYNLSLEMKYQNRVKEYKQSAIEPGS